MRGRTQSQQWIGISLYLMISFIVLANPRAKSKSEKDDGARFTTFHFGTYLTTTPSLGWVVPELTNGDTGRVTGCTRFSFPG